MAAAQEDMVLRLRDENINLKKQLTEYQDSLKRYADAMRKRFIILVIGVCVRLLLGVLCSFSCCVDVIRPLHAAVLRPKW
jgi:hypothetical protein